MTAPLSPYSGSYPYAVDVVVLSAAAAAACPPVLLRLGRLRLGKGVVGNFGGTLTDSLSPNSVSLVTLRPDDQHTSFQGSTDIVGRY